MSGARLFSSPVATEPERPRRQLLLLCQEFYPEQVATGKSLTELCEELVDMDVDVSVVCGQSTLLADKDRLPIAMTYRGMSIQRVANTRFSPCSLLGKMMNSVTFTVLVLSRLLRTKFDVPVLVSTTPPFLSFAAALASWATGLRYVLRVADVYPDTAVNLGILKERRPTTILWHFLNRTAYRRASAIIVLGRCMADVINRRTARRFADKVHCIHVWGDDSMIQTAGAEDLEANEFTTAWGLEGKFVVLYAGNMGRSHDIETIMKAARRLSHDPTILFLMVCSGYKRPWAIRFAAEHGLTNCQFRDHVEREFFPRLLRVAGVGLTCLQKGQEGLSVPSKAYGLMTAGVPQIAVMAPSAEIARVAVEEDCGVVVEPGDVDGLVTAISELRDAPARRRRMAENARRANTQRYSLKAAASRYYDLFCPLWEHTDSPIPARPPRPRLQERSPSARTAFALLKRAFGPGEA